MSLPAACPDTGCEVCAWERTPELARQKMIPWGFVSVLFDLNQFDSDRVGSGSDTEL